MENHVTPSNENQADSNENKTDGASFVAPRHWIGPEELTGNYWSNPQNKEKGGQEFFEKPVEQLAMLERMSGFQVARRDFLTIMGASMAMAATACARRPVHKIIPYIVQPEEITPGVPTFYASTDPATGYGLLVKTREGRPIKLEGNPEHPINRGRLPASLQATVLSLYDPERLQQPLTRNRAAGGSKAMKWTDIDVQIEAALKSAAQSGGRVRVLTSPTRSESSRRLTREFLSGFAAGAHIEMDLFEGGEIADASAESYGTAVVPRFHFDQAEAVVSFGADFLGTWLHSVEYAADWITRRQVSRSSAAASGATMSKTIVIESNLSLTGANADERVPVRSGEELKIAAAVAYELLITQGRSRFAGDGSIRQALSSYKPESVSSDTGVPVEKIREIAELLWTNRGKSLVVAGGLSTQSEQSRGLQVTVNLLNSALDNDGVTVDGSGDALPRSGRGMADLKKLIADMGNGSVDVLIMRGVNPAYSLPSALGFVQRLKKVGTVIAISDHEDETALLADFVLPDHHFLEAWGDSHPSRGVYSLQQPTIQPLFDSRSMEESFLVWARAGAVRVSGLAAKISSGPQPGATIYPPIGSPESMNTPELKALQALGGYSDWHNYIIANWRETVFPQHGGGVAFKKFWENTLSKGVIDGNAGRRTSGAARAFRSSAMQSVSAMQSAPQDAILMGMYTTIALADGASSNNAWLQEMPDPVSMITWDNYLNIGPALADQYKIKSNDVIEVSMGSTVVNLPANVQPGLGPNTVTVAIGYGRKAAGKVGTGVGIDVLGFVGEAANSLKFAGIPVSIKKTGVSYDLANTQWHNASENRPIINDLTLAQFKANAAANDHQDPHLRLEKVDSIWPSIGYPGLRWGMAIDLQSCIGCHACVIACQAENNIPVVGRDNVRISREMHWMRIDRYYSGPAENPQVIYQPMLCQHCENAPCETVCPVLATVHDEEGTNNMVYNRCVGTRYCQNNCPYKVRRFNFFDHWKSYDSTMNMAWNPDVTVRSRGVMEKCTFCIQRVQKVKDTARLEGRKVGSNEIKTACQQTCPTEAIVFGNINDPESRVSKLRAEKSAFRVLEALNVKPSISYLTKVRNTDVAYAAPAHGHDETHGSNAGEQKEGGAE